ncbi:MAG: chemotaxis protein CheW [Melioribacteraceae bacterium]|nr:MAG: chemotaxis protein CheW [Melioribacteraceae bacterium]
MKTGDKAMTDLQIVSFMIGKECYGLNILNVKEIIKMVNITSLPNVPDYVEGIINLRESVIPVIDLRKLLGVKNTELTLKTRIIVLEDHGKSNGFIVDEVSEVLRLDEMLLEDPPASTVDGSKEYIKQIAKLDDKMVILLDLDRLLFYVKAA